jgi:hypothetical protein
MITFKLVLLRSGRPMEIITVELPVVPSVHEYIMVEGQPYRVEDITYDVTTKEIEVRAVA